MGEYGLGVFPCFKREMTDAPGQLKEEILLDGCLDQLLYLLWENVHFFTEL